MKQSKADLYRWHRQGFFCTARPDAAQKQHQAELICVWRRTYLPAALAYPFNRYRTAYLAHRADTVPTVQMMGNQYEQHLYMLCDVMIMLLTSEMGLTYADLEKRHRNVE